MLRRSITSRRRYAEKVVWYCCTGPLLLCLTAVNVSARFIDEDADTVDQEELLSTENFNDEISYRPPFGWQRIWDAHEQGLRVNGGSYNANRFMYEEDIKLRSPLDKPATFSFTQERQQNLLGNFNERVLRVRFNQLAPLFPALMADGDSFKRTADFGASLLLSNQTSFGVEAYAWSVNHLYNQKRGHTLNTVRQPSRTIGAQSFFKPNGVSKISIKAEHDRPMVWDRISDGYNYKYERRYYQALASHGRADEGWYHALRYEREYKREFKYWYLSADDDLSKEMKRYAYEIEYAVNYASPHQYDLTQGLIFLERNVNYSWQPMLTDGVTKLSSEPEERSPNVTRLEQAYYLTYFFVSGSPGFSYQYGVFVNNVRLRKSPALRPRTEVKLTSALNYTFAEGFESYINATWNLDGVVKTYPYENEPFRPWDGGSIQFLATF